MTAIGKIIQNAASVTFFWLLVIFAILIEGCAVGPDYVAPETVLPDEWHQATTEGLAGGEVDVRNWWNYFRNFIRK